MTNERKAKVREHERTIASGARLKTEEILTDANRILFVREELRDLAGRGSVHGDVDLTKPGGNGFRWFTHTQNLEQTLSAHLVRLNGRNLLIRLNRLANFL